VKKIYFVTLMLSIFVIFGNISTVLCADRNLEPDPWERQQTQSNWLYDIRGEDTLKTFWQFILRLEVSESQKAQIKPLYIAQQQQYQKINNSTLSAKKKQAKIETLNRLTHEKVLATLTNVQNKQLQGMSGFQP
jgi:glutamyl-tRNA reductase